MSEEKRGDKIREAYNEHAEELKKSLGPAGEDFVYCCALIWGAVADAEKVVDPWTFAVAAADVAAFIAVDRYGKPGAATMASYSVMRCEDLCAAVDAGEMGEPEIKFVPPPEKSDDSVS